MIKILIEGRPTHDQINHSGGIAICISGYNHQHDHDHVIYISVRCHLNNNHHQNYHHCQILDLTTAGQYHNGDDDFSMAGEKDKKNHD